MISVDSSEAIAFAVDLGRVPGRVVPAVLAVAEKAAHNIKTQMAADAENGGHYQDFSGSITYDRVFSGLTAIEYEIGPDKARRQGALGNILYFGTSNNGPVLDLEGPVRAEEPKFLRAISEAATGAVVRVL